MTAIEQPAPTQPTPLEDPNRDLGFGSVVARESRRRLLNRDGSFNVRRDGLDFFASLSLYHKLLTISWPHFLALVGLLYLAFNTLFAFGFLACGPGAIMGPPASSMGGNEFLRAFFFSVQTFATIGYGHLSPAGLASNVLVTAESLFGLLGFALATGLLFARFSRPTAKIVFSKNAIIAPYQGRTAFEFRMVNTRSSQLVEIETTVTFSWFRDGAKRYRDFQPLRLERPKVHFFPLSLTVVHPIDESSPLFGMTRETLLASEGEFLILVTGFDETFSQMVHARSSYRAEEVVWGVKFANLFNPISESGIVSIDVGRLDATEPVQPALPAAP